MALIHDKYLPVTEEVLLEHFAPVAAMGDARRHLTYYLASAQAMADLLAQPPTGSAAAKAAAIRRGRQMEKDERFWIASSLLAVFHAADGQARLTDVLGRCLGDTPPFRGCDTWDAALGREPKLYFEVNMPSPPSYREWLAGRLNERVLVPYMREAAATRGLRLEGATKADAVLIAADTGFAVVFEAKVLADVSGHIEFDVLRNQLGRTIDVTLDRNPKLLPPLRHRDPERTCVVLVTPEVFRQNPSSRLYGWLLRQYQNNPHLVGEHLPHRPEQDWNAVVRRLGWLTFEEINEVLPGACGWLPGSPA